ncbi:MAG: GNAT family N-acetyltransferase [Dehalococcoidia bacterium]
MEVRRLRSGEALAYREVRLRALRLAPYAFSATFEEASARDETAWQEFAERLATSEVTAGFVLDRGDGSFGGLVSVRFDSGVAETAEVNQMWVDEDLRGGGRAEALLDAAERHAATAGVARVRLWVTETNERARRLYVRLGYAPTGATGPFPAGGLEIEFAKLLPVAGV